MSSSDCDRSVDATATYSAAVDRRLTVKARTSSRVAPEYGINATTILQDKISAGPTSEIQTGFEGRASPFSNDKKPRNHSFSSSDEESILTPQTNGLRSVQPTGAAVDASQKKGSRRWGRGAGGNAEVVEKRRMTLAAKVGAILSNLPLSKLKIVIGETRLHLKFTLSPSNNWIWNLLCGEGGRWIIDSLVTFVELLKVGSILGVDDFHYL